MIFGARRTRPARKRAFEPAVEGSKQLEERVVLDGGPRAGALLSTIPADGGRAVVLIDFDGETYKITAQDNNATPINPAGTQGFFASGPTIRARPVRDSKSWDIRVNGSSVATQILVEPMIHQRRRFEAHTFPHGSYDNDSILRVNNVIVPTGRLGAFLGYRTATLNGTLRVTDTAPLDRIAVYDINPGAAVITGGDINTFDVFNNLTVAGGPGIQVGRDLNWLNVGGNISITDGSEFVVGRDIGLMAQPPKGTDPGGQGAIVDGNLIIGPGSRFRIGRRLAATFLVFGNVQGSSRLIIPSGAGNFISVGGFVP